MLLHIFVSVFVHLFHFHPPVLEPNLHLSLCEVQDPRNLIAAIACQVHVKKELLFQLKGLVLCIRTALLPGRPRVDPVRRGIVCGEHKHVKRIHSKINITNQSKYNAQLGNNARYTWCHELRHKQFYIRLSDPGWISVTRFDR